MKNSIYGTNNAIGNTVYSDIYHSLRERSVARKNLSLEILDMSALDIFIRFDRKDEFSMKKTLFDEIRVKVSVDHA